MERFSRQEKGASKHGEGSRGVKGARRLGWRKRSRQEGRGGKAGKRGAAHTCTIASAMWTLGMRPEKDAHV